MHHEKRERKSTVLFRRISYKWNFPQMLSSSAVLFWKWQSTCPPRTCRGWRRCRRAPSSIPWTGARLELVSSVECGGVRPPLASDSAHYVSQLAGIALSTSAPSGPTPPRTSHRFLTFSTDFHRPTQMWSYDWRYGKSIFHYFSSENSFSTQNMTLSQFVWDLLIK